MSIGLPLFQRLLACILLTTVLCGTSLADSLPSWRDYVVPQERITVFDNDGTLWSEQPMYFQFLFALDRIKALVPDHPEWKTEQGTTQK